MGRDPRWILNSEFVSSTPACFDSKEQFKVYERLRHMTLAHAKTRSDTNFCLDCTPEYQQKMLMEGRCEHPETRFVWFIDSSGEGAEMVGISCRSIYWEKRANFETIVKDTYGEQQAERGEGGA